MILIDSSTGSKELVRYRPLNNDKISCLYNLRYGDVAFLGNGAERDLTIGIEVKNIPDVVKGLQDGRLGAQLSRMAVHYDVSYLLLYGAYVCGEDDRLLYRCRDGESLHAQGKTGYLYVESALLDIADAGIVVKTVTDIEQAALWIAACARQWSKPWLERGVRFSGFDCSSRAALKHKLRRAGILDKDEYRRACVAHALPGLGVDKAVEAALYFDSLQSMFAAEPADWQRVKGIGKTVAHSVVDFIRRRRKKSEKRA